MDGMGPEAVLEAEGESTAAELGPLLFRNTVTHMFHFTGTARFRACVCGQDLIDILAHMRRREPMPAALWAKLEARDVKEGQPDPRILDSKFLEATKEPLSGSSWRGCKPKAEGRERLRLTPRHLCVAQPGHQA